MKTKMIANVVAAACMMMTLASCQEVHKVRVAVVEEDGKKPVAGAGVEVRYLGYGSRREESVFGKTDEKGVFASQGAAKLRIRVFIEKPGYYKTKSGRLSRKKDHDLIFVLRRFRNPIALYARKYRGKVPGIGRDYGFDFEIGDWIAPHGRGRTADILFKVDIAEESGLLAGKIQMTFPDNNEGYCRIGPENGYIPGSRMVMPHEAPVGGYRESLERVESGYENKAKEPNVSYFFRTRIRKSSDGKMRFNYSKFNDGFNFVMGGGRFIDESQRSKYPEEFGLVEFTYYFNPVPNERNLEFDPEKNLFKHLKAEEWVHDP